MQETVQVIADAWRRETKYIQAKVQMTFQLLNISHHLITDDFETRRWSMRC